MPVFRFFPVLIALFFSVIGHAEDDEKWLSPESVDGTQAIDLQQAKQLHAEGVPFVDVRSARQFNKRRIPGAIHLYLKEGFSEASLLKYVNKDQPFVIYCNGAHCSLSYRAAEAAVGWGFTQIKYFRDGFRAWRLDDNPLEYGE